MTEDDDEGSLCPGCNGCGEGHFEGSRCATCGGSGDDRHPWHRRAEREIEDSYHERQERLAASAADSMWGFP